MTIIRAEKLSKWYGHVLGVSDIEWSVEGGVIGLLGPNGAGKSTLMKMIAGLMRPSRGRLEVFGAPPFSSRESRARIGYCPEHENTYNELTAHQLVTMLAELSGVPAARDAAAEALHNLGLEEAMNRRVGGFSKGMKQRAKLASCLVHDPDLLILDEPLTGVDPLARSQIVDKIRDLGAAGKTVLISSHVLYEIEALTEEIMVVYRGQVLAEGNMFEIRRLIDRHPHRIRVECEGARDLGAALLREPHVVSAAVEHGAVVLETRDPDLCYQRIAESCRELELVVRSLSSPDNNLNAVFDYLTGGRS